MSGLGPDLKELRASLGLGLISFAKELGTDAGTLSKWENGQRPIPLVAVLKIADVAPLEKKQSWLDAAGLRGPEPAKRSKASQALMRQVPLLKDSSVLGTVKASQAKEVERMWEVPKDWLPSGGTLQAIRAPDDSMSPMLEKGYIIVVEVSRRDAVGLRNTLVVARNHGGVCIRWLRRDMGLDLLMPLDLRHHAMVALDPKQGTSLVGEVVLWVGKPIEQ